MGNDLVRRRRPEISPELLRAVLTYNELTGELTWKPRPASMFIDEPHARMWNTRYSSKPALTYGREYKEGYILGQQCTAHRAIWAMVYGYWPLFIDHINGCGTDNRLANLREVTNRENGMNQKLFSTNTSGTPGVQYRKREKKWRSLITVETRVLYLGQFNKKEDAIAARKAAEVKFGYHPNHGRTVGDLRRAARALETKPNPAKG